MADISKIQTPSGDVFFIKDAEARTSLADKADKEDTVLLTTLSRGRKTTSLTGYRSIAFGDDVVASGNDSQAFGYKTSATGRHSTAEGAETVAAGDMSHAWGAFSQSNGDYSTASGYYTIANGMFQTVAGKSNVASSSFAEIIGNGASYDNRSNARALDWNGNEMIKGNLYVQCDADSTGGSRIYAVGINYDSNNEEIVISLV